MARCIHYKKGKFAMWSSVVDDYITYPMDIIACMNYLESQPHNNDIPERIARALKNGCSIIPKEIRCENISFFWLNIERAFKAVVNYLYITDFNHAGGGR
jgi:hypothetical protein